MGLTGNEVRCECRIEKKFHFCSRKPKLLSDLPVSCKKSGLGCCYGAGTETENGKLAFRVCFWSTFDQTHLHRLIYNRTTRTSEAPPGVFVRVPGFGKTFSLEYLDPSKQSVGESNSVRHKTKSSRVLKPLSSPSLPGMYFFSIVQSMVEWGYTRDDDVRGAPYDWRKAPSKTPGSTPTRSRFPCSSPLPLFFRRE